MWDIYHNFLCNWWFSRLAKLLDCKDCYFPVCLFVFSLASRILVDTSESSVLFSQCFFRSHWNKDKMLSENYPYLLTCFSKFCSSGCFSYILCFPIIYSYFWFINKHKNYYVVIFFMLSTCHVSSRIVADISESSLLFSQCFFRPYWNEDKMFSENYPYF